MSGSNTQDLKGNYCWPGIYGTRGQFTAEARPGARMDSTSWIGESGHLWLFGGMGCDSAGNFGYLNDIWEFDPSSGTHGEWAWIGGSAALGCQSCGPAGIYGQLGKFAPGNIPGGRSHPIVWTDESGNVWLFGGEGLDSSGKSGLLSDLWRFNPSLSQHGEWAWMGGSSTVPASCTGVFCGQAGVYGALGQFAAENIPGARDTAVGWRDEAGNFWLFGGAGTDSAGTAGFLNDIWKFEPAVGTNGEWAWMGGSATINVHTRGVSGNYGKQGQFGSTNVPGGRFEAVSWIDGDGKFWLFGGTGFDAEGKMGDLNDLWVFEPTLGGHGEWAWIAGNQTLGASGGMPGVYGIQGKFGAENTPGCRYSPVGWTSKSGDFWLFGGEGCDSTDKSGDLDDLWEFNEDLGTHGEWGWMGGNRTLPTTCSFCGQPAVFGPVGQYAAGNIPGGRNDAVSWTDNQGNFWLFGGQGFYSSDTGGPGMLNDLWESKLLITQTITFLHSPRMVSYGVKPVTLTAAGGGSGNPVVFSVISGPGKVSGTDGSTLKITGAGKVVVAANQSGSSNYAAANEATHTIVVNKAVLRFTASNLTMNYGAKVPTLIYTTSGFVNGDTAAEVLKGNLVLSTTAGSKPAVGTYPITIAVGTLHATNYSFTFKSGTLTVKPLGTVATPKFNP